MGLLGVWRNPNVHAAVEAIVIRGDLSGVGCLIKGNLIQREISHFVSVHSKCVEDVTGPSC